MLGGLHVAAALADKLLFLLAPLLDGRHGDSAQPQGGAEHHRAQHAVHVGHGIHPQAPRIGGQAPHTPQGVVHTLDIYIHKTEIEPCKKGSKHGSCRYRHPQVGIGLLQGP